MARMTQQHKLKLAIQYQEQGYNIYEIIKFLEYKNLNSIKHLIALYEGSLIKGKITVNPENLEEKKKKIVQRKCTKCSDTFKTKTDRTGFPLNTRCPACKTAEKKSMYTKYSDHFYRGRLG